MNPLAIPYERNLKTKLVRFMNDAGWVTEEEHQDVCPGCLDEVTWKRECDEWVEIAPDNWIPNIWNSWHCHCDGCNGDFISPSDDGLVFFVPKHESEEDYE